MYLEIRFQAMHWPVVAADDRRRMGRVIPALRRARPAFEQPGAVEAKLRAIDDASRHEFPDRWI